MWGLGEALSWVSPTCVRDDEGEAWRVGVGQGATQGPQQCLEALCRRRVCEGEAGEGLGEGVQGGPERCICGAFGEVAVEEGARVQRGGKRSRMGWVWGSGPAWVLRTVARAA
jgi:hypothetical protein